MNLLTIADGFGDSDAVPTWYPKYIKWPKIIELMTKGVRVTNLSRYGAGNEYIINALRQHIPTADIVLVQWAMPNRLDLIVDPHNTNLLETIAKDVIYSNNIVTLNDHSFWLSSGSKTPLVQEYHSKYISLQQHQLRSQMFIDYAKLLVNQFNVEHQFMLTWDSLYLEGKIDNTIKWSWHSPFKGMHDFRRHSKFSELDLSITQPIPLIHFDFIKTYIMPHANLNWRNDREINAVESMLYEHYKQSILSRPK